MALRDTIDGLIDRYLREQNLDRRTTLIRATTPLRGRCVVVEVSAPEQVEPLRAFLAGQRLELDAAVLPRTGTVPGTRAMVNVAVAPLRSAGNHRADVVSEALLGEPLTLLDSADEFHLVRAADGYLGWVDARQVVPQDARTAAAWDAQPGMTVAAMQTRIHEAPAVDAPVCRTATVGARLPELGRQGGWIRVRLPDGVAGWLRGSREFRVMPPRTPAMQRSGVCETGRQFLGIPYVWGGRSPLGFDCSGLMQLVYALHGLPLPRDADQQAACGERLGDDPRRCRPGDLMCFGEGRVTHVALYTGRGMFIHAQGYVRQNSLRPSHMLYHSGLSRTFLFARSLIGSVSPR